MKLPGQRPKEVGSPKDMESILDTLLGYKWSELETVTHKEAKKETVKQEIFDINWSQEYPDPKDMKIEEILEGLSLDENDLSNDSNLPKEKEKEKNKGYVDLL